MKSHVAPRFWVILFMAGLVGLYYRSIDDKCRLVIPPELRNRLDAQAVVAAKWYDQTIALFPEEAYSRLAEALSRQGSSEPKKRLVRRKMLSEANVINLDSQGRMTVPEHLLEGVLMDEKKDRDLVIAGDWDKVLIHSGLRFRDMAAKDQVNLDEALSYVEKLSRRSQAQDEGEETTDSV